MVVSDSLSDKVTLDVFLISSSCKLYLAHLVFTERGRGVRNVGVQGKRPAERRKSRAKPLAGMCSACLGSS